jgi:hypothetical protein
MCPMLCYHTLQQLLQLSLLLLPMQLQPLAYQPGMPACCNLPCLAQH